VAKKRYGAHSRKVRSLDFSAEGVSIGKISGDFDVTRETTDQENDGGR
jgi:hypothetical protein